MKFLAIDYGSKHIGLAKGDNVNKMALPYLSLENNGSDNLINKLEEIVNKEGIGIIIIGLPLNMAGEVTKQTEEIEEFVDLMRKQINVEIILEDERFTSEISRKLGGPVDEHQLAAQQILQSYLDKK